VYRKILRQIFGVVYFIYLLSLVIGCSTKHIATSAKYSQYEGEINQHTSLIQAETHRVFHILTHQDTFNAICPQGTIVTFEPLSPYQMGTFVNTKIDHIFKLVWRSKVVEMIPNKKIRLQFLDGFFTGGTEIWELEPENGFTRATHTIIIRPQGFIKKLAWNLKVRRKHNKMVDSCFDNLKRVSETE
jgi:hypothetical protein